MDRSEILLKINFLLSLKTTSSREIHLSSLFPIGFTGRKNKFGLLNGHVMEGFSCPALPSCGDLSRHSGHRQNDYNCRLFAISDHTRSIFRTLWYKGVMKTVQIAYCDSSRMQCCVSCDLFTDFTGRVGHGTNSLTTVTCGSQSNAKLYLQKNSCVQNPPVELTHLLWSSPSYCSWCFIFADANNIHHLMTYIML